VRSPLAGLVHHLFDTSIFLEASFPVALYVYLMERAAIGLFRRRRTPMFAVSPSTRAELESKGIRGEEISLVYNCVDHVTHTPDESERSPAPLIGYFGRLKKYKSVDHLLRAFVPVRSAVPGVKLVIVGEGDHRAELERLAASLGVAGDVEFTGYVSEEEKIRLLRRVSFVVNTSSKEGWGLTVIEANACRTMVLGSDVPGLRDAIQDGTTGLLYRYGDIPELTRSILRLLSDEALRDRLAEAAYTWSLTFEWGRVAESTVALLEQAIRRRSR
jgi:glycosyltransferase involved in cell wall biosynthesis